MLFEYIIANVADLSDHIPTIYILLVNKKELLKFVDKVYMGSKPARLTFVEKVSYLEFYIEKMYNQNIDKQIISIYLTGEKLGRY